MATLFGGELLDFWDGTGWVDGSAWLTSQPRIIKQGRSTPYEDIAAGSLTFSLANVDGRWTPGNQGSPYAAWFKAGTQVRYVVERAGVWYPRFWGTITAIEPDFPGSHVAGAQTAVTVVDNLGFIETLRSESRWTTALRYFSELDGAIWHAWRLRGDGAAGASFAQINPASGARAVVFTTPTNPTGGVGALSYGSADGLSVDGMVSLRPSSTRWSSVVKISLPSQTRAVGMWIRFPGTVQTSPTSSYRRVLQFLNAAGVSIGHVHIAFTWGSGDNLLWTIEVGEILDATEFAWSVGASRWDLLRITDVGGGWSAFQLGSNPPRSFPMDLTAVTRIAVGGVTGMDCAEMDVAGIVASSSPIGLPNSAAYGQVEGVSNLIGDTNNLSAFSPKSFYIPTSADGSAPSAMGDWAGRPLAEVARTVARTAGAGVLWARSSDSTLYVIPGAQCYPASPVVTLSAEGDLIGAPRLTHSIADRPTRVLIAAPTGDEMVVDTVLEASLAGQERRLDVETFAVDAAAARDIGAAVLAIAGDGTRISEAMIDLVSGTTAGVVEALFAAPGDIPALYPTARLRFTVPASHFGASTVDGHVQGWVETYAEDSASITVDLSPAALSRTSVTNPGAVTTGVGDTGHHLQILATNSAALALTYAWGPTTPPPACVLNIFTGLITGSPDVEGSWTPTVIVTASDGSSASVTWTWTATTSGGGSGGGSSGTPATTTAPMLWGD